MKLCTLSMSKIASFMSCIRSSLSLICSVSPASTASNFSTVMKFNEISFFYSTQALLLFFYLVLNRSRNLLLQVMELGHYFLQLVGFFNHLNLMGRDKQSICFSVVEEICKFQNAEWQNKLSTRNKSI
jgi:hypothetical protein